MARNPSLKAGVIGGRDFVPFHHFPPADFTRQLWRATSRPPCAAMEGASRPSPARAWWLPSARPNEESPARSTNPIVVTATALQLPSSMEATEGRGEGLDFRCRRISGLPRLPAATFTLTTVMAGLGTWFLLLMIVAAFSLARALTRRAGFLWGAACYTFCRWALHRPTNPTPRLDDGRTGPPAMAHFNGLNAAHQRRLLEHRLSQQRIVQTLWDSWGFTRFGPATGGGGKEEILLGLLPASTPQRCWQGEPGYQWRAISGGGRLCVPAARPGWLVVPLLLALDEVPPSDV